MNPSESLEDRIERLRPKTPPSSVPPKKPEMVVLTRSQLEMLNLSDAQKAVLDQIIAGRVEVRTQVGDVLIKPLSSSSDRYFHQPL